MTGHNPTDRRSKLCTKRHVLKDKKGIPLSAVITSASTHDIKAVTDVIDNAIVVKRKPPFYHLSQRIKQKSIVINIYVLIGHTTLNL